MKYKQGMPVTINCSKPKKMLEVVTAVIGNIMIWENIINETTV